MLYQAAIGRRALRLGVRISELGSCVYVLRINRGLAPIAESRNSVKLGFYPVSRNGGVKRKACPLSRASGRRFVGLWQRSM